jgi:hypothetical protein
MANTAPKGLFKMRCRIIRNKQHIQWMNAYRAVPYSVTGMIESPTFKCNPAPPLNAMDEIKAD